jgi:ABC-type multidrug transport system permease subunit
MLRTIALTFLNEFRLLAQDGVGLFMLLLAPIVIITVAGFSLGNIYGARMAAHTYTVPLVDEDHGAVARAIIDALDREPAVTVEHAANLDRARAIVSQRDRAPLAILIPAGTTTALAAGRPARIVLYVDPIKRLEISVIELRVGDLCQRITAAAEDQARARIANGGADLRARLTRISAHLDALQTGIAGYQRQLASAQSRAEVVVRNQIRRQISSTIDALRTQTQAAVERSLEQAKASVANELTVRRDAIAAVTNYLVALEASEREFDRWFAALKAAAGSHADAIPPPPAFPAPPTQAALAVLAKPIDFTFAPPHLPPPGAGDAASATSAFSINLPSPPPPPALPGPQLCADLEAIAPAALPVIPGALGWAERSVTGSNANVNSFDQYVPGFGITFLLIGMLMGISLGLIDERDWGTLARLRVSGAPLAGTLIGKLLARFLVGMVQMVVLLAIGYWLFGVSLGRNPAMLLLPAAAISFAAAAFGLIIACVARTHDSVMPFGAVVAMAMSAIGGCWWPLDFEPSWMRAFAQLLPTTWTMLAFNNLMIRDLPAASALWPSLATVTLGIVFLVVGLFGASRLYD